MESPKNTHEERSPRSSTVQARTHVTLSFGLVFSHRGYIALLALGLLGGFGFIETESNGEAAPAWAIVALAALMIGTMIGLATDCLSALRPDATIATSIYTAEFAMLK